MSRPLGNSSEQIVPESSLQEGIKSFYFSPINVQWVYETDRIALALESGLPNEVEWGLEALLRWSNECPLSYSIDNFPYLCRVLLEEFTNYTNHFNSVLTKRVGTLVPTPFLLLALGLRNCTVSEESAAVLAETSQLPDQIVQLLMLPQPTTSLLDALNYPELHTYCTDILDNMGSYIVPSPSLLEWLCSGIFGDDRSQVLWGLRLMTKLMLGKHDQTLELAIDHEKLLRHIFALLTLPEDAELQAAVIEFITLYSYFLPHRLTACATQFPFLISSLLSLFLANPTRSFSDVLVEKTETTLENIEGWLRDKCEVNPLQKISAMELYSEYMQEARSRRLPTLSILKFIRILRVIFPTTKVTQLRHRGKPTFFLSRIGRKSARLLFDAPVGRKLQPRTGEIIPCCWDNCQALLETKLLALEHVKLTHMPDMRELYCCKWSGCSDAYVQKPVLRHALLTHMRSHINYAHRGAPETPNDSHTPVPTRSTAPQSPAVTSGPSHTLGLLLDLLKKLAALPAFVPAFLPHHSALLSVATNVPLLAKDMLNILDLLVQQQETEAIEEASTSPESIILSA